MLLALVLAATASAAPYSSVTVVGKTGGGILRFPQAVAYDDSGVPDPRAGAPAGPYVYVADQYSFLVQKFTRSGTFVRQWGGFGTAPGRFGNANGDTVGGIGGVAVDGAGRVYVLDSYNDRIQQFTAGGTFQRSWGSTGTAPGQFQLGIGGGLAIRGSSLFVADQNNHRVQRFTLDSTGAPVGTPLTFGSFGTGDGQLDHPQGVGVDADAVYVADDRNDRVVRFSHAGAYLGMTTGNATAPFSFAYDASVDSLGRLYVADNNNHRVQEFDAATFAYRRRWGLLGTEVGRFGYPRSLAGVKGDPAGGVFVGDTSNNRVQSFAPDATSRGLFGVNGRGPGLYMQPKSVAVNQQGEVWIADTFSDRVQKVSAAGLALASYSRVSTFGPAPGGGPGEFRNPYGVAVDRASGAVYVADTGNDRVQRFDGTTWTAVAGTTFNAPRGVWVDASRRLLVADTGNDRVLRLSGTTWSAVGTGLSRPEAVSGFGTSLYVADTGNSRVVKLDAATGALQRTVAAAGTGAGQVREPEGVTVDGYGNVLVSDTGNDRVQRFDASGPLVDSWGGNGTAAGQLIKPAQIGFDTARRVWVADPFNNRVQRYTLPEYSFASSPASVSVARGSTATITLSVAPTGGFARPVTLRAGCPSRATCSLSTSTLTPANGAYPTATLRITPGSATPAGATSVRIDATTTSPTIQRVARTTVTVS
jgi:sugar lactone lactonase YvrE